MNVEDCFYLGLVARAHGLKGTLRVVFDVTDLSDYAQADHFLFLIGGNLVKKEVAGFQIINNTEAYLQIKGVEDKTQAEALAKCQIYLPLSELPDLEDGSFFYHEITAFTVVDKNEGVLGKVLKVQEMPAQDLVVMSYKGKEVLIPMTDEILISVDRDKKEVHTHLPEGLLEVYL